MSSDQLPVSDGSNTQRLELRLESLQQELEKVQQQTLSFETILRTRLASLIVEAQELHVLYKAIKKAKKAKRLEQKKRGKNYKEPRGLQRVSKGKSSDVPLEDEKEKKRLYREAMLHVHPDKFSMSETETQVATEVTSRLIEIYKTESLATLQAYHTHIFSGHTTITLCDSAATVQVLAKAKERSQRGKGYLHLQIEKVKAELVLAKNNQLYKVTIEYKDPLTFIDELREYYEDRIFRLKKRTRKGL